MLFRFPLAARFSLAAMWIACAAAQTTAAPAVSTTPAPTCWSPQFTDYMNSGGGWLMFSLGWLLGVLVAALAAVLIANRAQARAQAQQARFYSYMPVVYAPDITF